MSKTFLAQSEIDRETGKARLSLGSDHNRARFADFLKANPGVRLRIEAITPESRKQRKFFEGAVVPFVAFFQENLDHKDSDDLQKVRDWLKIEFNGAFITLGGKAVKVPKSTKGELNRGFIERILDWCGEQGYPTELLNPEEYRKWKDKIFPYGGPDDYIDYLVQCGRIGRNKGVWTSGGGNRGDGGAIMGEQKHV